MKELFKYITVYIHYKRLVLKHGISHDKGQASNGRVCKKKYIYMKTKER